MNLKLPQFTFLTRLRPIWRFRVVLFAIFIASLAGYLVLQINAAINVSPANQAPVTAVKSPRIDPQIVQQLQSLQDNSVSVQSLFDQARDNPFQ